MKPPASEDDLIAGLLDLTPDEREDYLRRTCGNDHERRQRLLERADEFLRALSAAPSSSDSRAPSSEADLVRALTAGLDAAEKPAARVDRYELVARLGEGGFGTVWLAEQQRPVRRRVALKIIKLGMDTREVVARFEAERQALALMEHPHIARVFDAGATEAGRPYFAMEFVRGIPITRYCDEQSMTIRDRLRLFVQVCQAVQHAHQKGVVHRDLKPSNILVSSEHGQPVPKVIDFGIAKAMNVSLTERTLLTHGHAFVGTPVYTSPEQMETGGLDVDTRTDIYSLGILLYELLTGGLPFDARALSKSGWETLRRVIREQDPARPSVRVNGLDAVELTRVAAGRALGATRLAPLLRSDLDWIVLRCLEKDPARRYETASALAADVQHYLADEPVEARAPSTTYRLGKFVRRHRVGVSASIAIVGLIVAGSLVTTMQSLRALRAERLERELREAAQRAEVQAADARRVAAAQELRLSNMRWARETALPEISRLLKRNDVAAAFALARKAGDFLVDDPVLASLWLQVSTTVAVETTPAGADVYVKPYDHPGEAWQYLGKTPLQAVRLPRCVHRWRIEKDGYTPVEKADGWPWNWEERRLNCALFETSATPPGMVRVQAVLHAQAGVRMTDEFWIDQHEVTNREFHAFVAAGGYASRTHWKQPFRRDGGELGWSEAMALFRDRTGQPGPAGWRDGMYPEGEENYPVTGVSWFEAAAYAEFVGKRLPSLTHWHLASGRGETEYLLAFGNFGPAGSAPVGAYQGVSSSGAVDMAGNAREWCWNEAPDGGRFLLGGGWGEAEYMYVQEDAASPFDRGPKNGFRCLQTDEGKPVPAAIDAPKPPVSVRSYAAETPVSDEEFAVIRRIYAYDRTSLDPRIEGVAVENARWRRERVSFNAAYNGERMDALLYLPRSARPPYQVIIYCPNAGAMFQQSSESPRDLSVIEALLETRRAIVYPIYAGTYERQSSAGRRRGEVESLEWRKHVVQDARRTIDYLESRPDLQADRVAFVGSSWGAAWGPIVSALEDRIKVNVFVAGGLPGGPLPEADPFTFVPRVTVPTLIINGRRDFLCPLETMQLPLFRALGTPAEHKRHLLVEGGHAFPIPQVIPEIREWLDRYLGPVDEVGPH